jgi:hypothetical protein
MSIDGLIFSPEMHGVPTQTVTKNAQWIADFALNHGIKVFIGPPSGKMHIARIENAPFVGCDLRIHLQHVMLPTSFKVITK